jgi:putative ABC transport system permease protein
LAQILNVRPGNKITVEVLEGNRLIRQVPLVEFLTLISIPLGFGLGAAASAGLVEALQTDMYQLPFVLGSGTLSLAATIVLGASVVSGIIIFHKLKKLDLIGVLKTRE